MWRNPRLQCQEREEAALKLLKHAAVASSAKGWKAGRLVRSHVPPYGSPSCHSASMANWTSEAVLALYRALLRQGRGLRYTDRDFYFNYIRREFRKNQHLDHLQDKERQLEKGQAFLHSKLGGLV